MKKQLFWVMAATLLLFGSCGKPQTPEEVVEEGATALAANELATANDLACPRAEMQMLNEWAVEMFREDPRKAQEYKAEYTNDKVIKREMDGNRARLEYSADAIILQCEDGDGRIWAYKSDV